MNDQLTPDAERTALEDMLRSDGWRVFREHMATAWGPEAYERQLDTLLEGAPSDDDLAITRRIRDTFKGVRASLLWPEERVKALKGGKPASGDPFSRFRRRA